MALELASKKIGRRIDVLREEIAGLRNVETVSLPEILKIDPASDYTVWVEGAKKARRFFANRKERKDSRAGTKIVQILNSEFKTQTRWRQLMNRLAADQVSDQISSIRNLNGEQAMVIAIRKMAITQAKLVGSPDAEELVDFLIKEDQTSHASTDEKRQKKASGNSEISELAKDKPKQERLEETEKAKVAKRKANKEVLKSQLTSEEKKRIAREQLIEADKVKEALARQRAFHAGEWKFCPCESDSPAPEPTAREMSISLTSSGSFFSTHDETKAKGVKTTVQISGDWDYDYIRQVLALEGTKKIKTTSEGFLSSLLSSLTNGVQTDPYSSRFTITNSANGIHKAYDSDGEQWSIRKSL